MYLIHHDVYLMHKTAFSCQNLTSVDGPCNERFRAVTQLPCSQRDGSFVEQILKIKKFNIENVNND